MGWGLPREGVGVEKLVPSLESLFCLGFEGGNLKCPGILPGCPRPLRVLESLCKEILAHFPVPTNVAIFRKCRNVPTNSPHIAVIMLEEHVPEMERHAW